jgi:hypothetical protein
VLRPAVLQQPPELGRSGLPPGKGRTRRRRSRRSRQARTAGHQGGRSGCWPRRTAAAGFSASTGRTGPTRSGGGPHRTRHRCGAGLPAARAASSCRTIRSARVGIRACRSAGMPAGPVHARAGDDSACTGPGPAAGPGRRSRRTPASMSCTGRSRPAAHGPARSPGTSSWLPPLAGGASTGSSSHGR